MKPPPPPMVSIRFLEPGASVLRFHLIPALAVMSTNWIGLEACGTLAFTSTGFHGSKQNARRRDTRSANFIKQASLRLESGLSARRGCHSTDGTQVRFLKG